MKGNILEEMLLIQEPSVFKLYEEMMKITGYFIAPVFTIALLIEYFGEMDFGSVVKKLLLITIFMGSFYHFHSKAVDLSLQTASYTLNKVSPRNLFVKKWFYAKVKTKEQKQWGFLDSFAIPNLNDLVATAFFILAKVFIWLLKLIYSSVYHLTYVFSGLTAILYFLGWTKDAIKGTFQASLWCMFLPFVIVAILALVGNSIEETAIAGELVVAKIDTIIWLFGVTLLLLISPLITFGMIKGEGVHSFGSKMGAMVVSSGLKASAFAPFLVSIPSRVSQTSSKLKSFGGLSKERIGGFKSKESHSFKGGEKTNSEMQKSNSQQAMEKQTQKVGSVEMHKSQSNQSLSKAAPVMTISKNNGQLIKSPIGQQGQTQISSPVKLSANSAPQFRQLKTNQKKWAQFRSPETRKHHTASHEKKKDLSKAQLTPPKRSKREQL